MKRQPYFYRSILAAIAATVAGMDFSATAAMLPATDSAAPALAAVFSPTNLSPATGHSASLTMTESGPSPYPAYVGTSDPDGTANASTITVPNTDTGYSPGLLNGVFFIYGVNYTKGAVTINAFNGGDSEIIAVSLIGVFHGSLMSSPSPYIVADIISDLDASLSLPAGVTARVEPFNDMTPGTLEYDNPGAHALLSEANVEYSTFQFSLAVLVSGVNTDGSQTFGFDLSNETVDQIQVLGVKYCGDSGSRAGGPKHAIVGWSAAAGAAARAQRERNRSRKEWR